MTDEQLSALLRLKRHEKPPTGYFDRLLQDVHRRQRAELLRLPLWQIAVERVRVFFGEHSMSPATYAGSMAALLLVGMATIRFTIGTPTAAEREATLAKAPVARPTEKSFTLQMPAPAPTLARAFRATPSEPAAVTSQPRYIMDARPVSYDPSRNFAF